MDCDVCVIGGGAAGFFAAITCAEANPELRVVIVEKGREVLSKVRISGGGRCNVTHACFEPSELIKRYPRGGRELRGPFHTWQPSDTVNWFESHGVKLKTEADGRMFPMTDRSETIVNCLKDVARQASVRVMTGCGLDRVEVSDGGGFDLSFSDGSRASCRALLIASGGLKPGPIHRFVEESGHTIEPLAPSLFTFHIKDKRLEDLAGVSVEQAEVMIPEISFREKGPILITHWGLSGPAILKLSAMGARWIQSVDYAFDCRVNWVGGSNLETIGAELRRSKSEAGRRHIWNSPVSGLPRRLWEKLTAAAIIPETLTWSHASAPQLAALARQLTTCEFRVAGKSMNKEEFVTCGGVRLKEVDFKTMESRIIPNLYFAGEVLDIDAVTGGFNFQAAWTTGYLAGRAMALKPG